MQRLTRSRAGQRLRRFFLHCGKLVLLRLARRVHGPNRAVRLSIIRIATVLARRGDEPFHDCGKLPCALAPRAVKTNRRPTKRVPEQIAAVRVALHDLGEASSEQVARRFRRAWAGSVQPLLESLTAPSQARITENGRFAV